MWWWEYGGGGRREDEEEKRRGREERGGGKSAAGVAVEFARELGPVVVAVVLKLVHRTNRTVAPHCGIFTTTPPPFVRPFALLVLPALRSL